MVNSIAPKMTLDGSRIGLFSLARGTAPHAKRRAEHPSERPQTAFKSHNRIYIPFWVLSGPK